MGSERLGEIDSVTAACSRRGSGTVACRRPTQEGGQGGGAGIAERTLWNAKRKLGIKAEREGFGPGAVWHWKLP